MQMKFSTPCAFRDEIMVSSFGFSGAMDPNTVCYKIFPRDLKGVLLTGTYEEILNSIPSGNYQAGVAFLGNCGMEDEFIKNLSQKAGCGLTGGSAAIDPKTGEKGLVLGRGQAAVYLIADERYVITVKSENIHTVQGECAVRLKSPRVFASIDGQDPVTWFNARRLERSLSDTDFEHFTLSDSLGVNAHLSIADGELVSGRNLEETMFLRYVAPDEVDEKIRIFYDDETALVCGCAGLKGILKAPMNTRGTGLFLFGEVCTVNGVSKFGNLMLSKLCVNEK